MVKQTQASGGRTVLMIHCAGAATHNLYLEIGVYERFIYWLAQQQTIWTELVRAITQYIKQQMQAASR